MTEKTKGSRGLWLIGAFKLVKGLGLLILAIGALAAAQRRRRGSGAMD
jgi:hypothetical protein